MTTRADALAAYEALPLPDTTEEHWRFTDLKDFDVDSFSVSDTAKVAGSKPARSVKRQCSSLVSGSGSAS